MWIEYKLTRKPATNSRFAKAGVSCPPQADEVQIIPKAFGIVHLMKFSAENPRLLQSSKRYVQ
jgi:hypothetical protein